MEKVFVSVYKPIAGYKAILIGDGEVIQTGYFAHATRKGAEEEARHWAEAEEIPYQSHFNEESN